jgi:hypothetical protein
MKKALISTIEPREYFDGSKGYRVAQVEENTFSVTEPDLYWIDCDDNVVQDIFYFDTTTNTILPIPVMPPKIQASIAENQPTTNGTQTI